MRLEEKFQELKKENRKAFSVYFPFGFPEVCRTPDIFFALQNAGVDMIELGYPFSDPLADGPIIQKASWLALTQPLNLKIFFKTIKKMRPNIKIPLVAMSYYNPVFNYGVKNFFQKLAEIGVSGSILVDLPLEESSQYRICAKQAGIDPIFFITPATSLARAKKIAQASRGFVYYISVTGITGPRQLKLGSLANHLKEIKKFTDIPVCVGFGIHNRYQVEKITSFSDGVIVGSVIIEFINKNYKKKGFLKKLEKKVKELNVPKN